MSIQTHCGCSVFTNLLRDETLSLQLGPSRQQGEQSSPSSCRLRADPHDPQLSQGAVLRWPRTTRNATRAGVGGGARGNGEAAPSPRPTLTPHWVCGTSLLRAQSPT